MQRRSALTLAATIGGTIFAATAALAVNLGIVDDAAPATPDPVAFSDVVPTTMPLAPATPPVTIIVEEVAPATSAGAAPAPVVEVAPAAAAAPAPVVAFDDDDDDGDDHGGDRDDAYEDDHDDDDHEDDHDGFDDHDDDEHDDDD